MQLPSEPTGQFDGDGFSDPKLRVLYDNSSGPIAFIDESYRAPSQALEGNAFYILTAVVIARPRIVAVRDRLLEIANGTKWHTTEVARVDGGRAAIVRMTEYLASCSTSIVAYRAGIPATDRFAEQARALCFRSLLTDLCVCGTLALNGAVVYERRRDTSQLQADGRTISGLRRANGIHRALAVHPGSPASEFLLVAPDAVAWSTRQLTATNDKRFLEPLSRTSAIRIVNVR